MKKENYIFWTFLETMLQFLCVKYFEISPLVLYQVDSSSNLVSSSSNRFYWIRISLFEKKLHKIVAYLVKNSEK